MGAYRVALDNELIVKKDVRNAVLITTLGIAALLFLAFHRPLLGLFAFLPAFAGTAAAFFVFSLLHSSVSLMALGFGGAVISITVDQGIAFLLFLDRPVETRGKDAAREIRAVGLLAALTTIGAFGALSFLRLSCLRTDRSVHGVGHRLFFSLRAHADAQNLPFHAGRLFKKKCTSASLGKSFLHHREERLLRLHRLRTHPLFFRKP